MPRLIHAVLCQQVLTDTETSAVSYINVLEDVVVASAALPVRLPPIGLGCSWMADADGPDTINVRVRACFPDGESGIYEVDPIPMDARRQRHNLTLLGVVARSEGDVVFQVEAPGPDGQWAPVAVLPLTIKVEAGEKAAE